MIKLIIMDNFRHFLAEEEGFEPPVVLPTTVFKTAPFNHSGIPPLQR